MVQKQTFPMSLNGSHSFPLHEIPPLDVAIIGAGAAGLGVALALQRFGVENYVVLERESIGASFEHWPAEMRFITPSFPSNPFGCPDLNAIAPELAVAVNLKKEHPSGPEYARHLRDVVDSFGVSVREGVEVLGLEPLETPELGHFFRIETRGEPIYAHFVVWAAGEFFYPRLNPFPGAQLCRHNSQIQSYAALEGDDFLVIGGYESGIDAAVHLAAIGQLVRVLDSQRVWDEHGLDPSLTLSPHTRERLEHALATGLVELVGNAKIACVKRQGANFVAVAEDGREFLSSTPPILATGFEGSLGMVKDLFAWNETGRPLLTENDESTTTPGLFLCGPMLRHPKSSGEDFIFCFIYKFRGRFPIVAETITAALEMDTTDGREWYQAGNMYLDDLSCCDKDCHC